MIADNDTISMGQTPYLFTANTKKTYEVSADSKGSVLIVDDSRMSRVILKNVLEEAGYSVIAEATNGEEAVEMFRQHPVDLVTLDITMPKMDGLEALQKILETGNYMFAINDCDSDLNVFFMHVLLKPSTRLANTINMVLMVSEIYKKNCVN